MIHYVLGHGGSGKTIYCLNRFRTLENAVFFAALRDESDEKQVQDCKLISLGEPIAEKCVVNIADMYRQNLDDSKNFEKIMKNAIKEAMSLPNTTIFLDEFQLYCTDELKDLICNSDQDFYIVHQFPKQLDDEHFSAIWKKSGKKYLLDPYQPSDFYRV